MTPKDYIKSALLTEVKDYSFKATGGVTPRTEHAVLGLVNESAELLEEIKRVKIYRKKFEKNKMAGDLGDLMWYLALLLDDLGLSFEKVWEANIEKLKKRFPEGYVKDAAIGQK